MIGLRQQVTKNLGPLVGYFQAGLFAGCGKLLHGLL
jgi:hypothetical protein